MSLIIAEAGMDTPIYWNFGKIEVKFNKPLDPLSISESFKNNQKPKLEHTFEVEQHTKTSIASPIFSALILIVVAIYLRYLKSINLNIDNFPKKNKTAAIFSFLFIIVVALYAYLLVLFWLKLNIVQTLIAFILLGIASSVIIFKTVVSVNIEI